MKNTVFFLVILSLFSCKKKNAVSPVETEEISSVAPYDTVAIDSFSAGATSVNVAKQITISSVKYQDSLRENKKKLEAEKATQKELQEKEKAAKKLEEEKKKLEAEKKKTQRTEVKTPETSTQ